MTLRQLLAVGAGVPLVLLDAAGLKVDKINTNSEKQPEMAKNIVSICKVGVSSLVSQLLLNTEFTDPTKATMTIMYSTFVYSFVCKIFRVTSMKSVVQKRKQFPFER